MNMPIVGNNVSTSNKMPSFGKGELFLPYGVSTADEGTRIDLNTKNRAEVYKRVEGLVEGMPDHSYLSMNKHGISLVTKSGQGPIIPFELNTTKKNLEKFYTKFEAACKQAINEATKKPKTSLFSFLKRK